MITTGTLPSRLSWRDPFAIAAGISAVAAAIWLIPASISIVAWGAGGPTRVALFGRWPLAGAAIGTVVGIAAVFAWTGKSRARLARAASGLAPLSLLWLWTVPYLPWLPDRIPLLLVFAGPIRWAIAVIALAGATRIFDRLAVAAPRLQQFAGRRMVFAASLAIYLAFGVQGARAFGPGGDEPHYLMIAQSLLADGDLLIANNHERKEYQSFYGGDLRPDYMAPGRDGKIYSIHAPGLPVVLLPAYAVGGYPGALVVMCLLAAFTALAMFDLAEAVAGRRAALLTWVATCLTVPFIPNAWLIYPEMPGALIVAWTARWIWKPLETRAAAWFWRGCALATLPWLHTKFVVFLAIFALALAYPIRRNWRALVALATPIAVSLAAWLWYFYRLYGVVNPEAPYGDYSTLHVLIRNIPRGLLGLLFDQKFGVLVYSPIYLAALAGCWMMVRRGDLRWLALVLLVSIAAFVGSTTRLYMWWGGSSPPARFLVPVVPMAAPMIALAFAGVRGAWARPLFAVWLVLSAGVALAGGLFPGLRLIAPDPHGDARVLELLEAGAPLAGSFPTFTVEDWRSPLLALLPWLAAAAVAFGALAIIVRITPRRSSLWYAVLASVVFVVVAGVATARPEAALREETARRGALDVIWQWDPDGRVAFEYGRNARVDSTRLGELNGVTWRGAMAGPVALPAGAYEARVWFAGAGAADGEILVTNPQKKAIFGKYTGIMHNPMSVPFDLPAAVAGASVNVYDEALAARVVRSEIVPLAVVPVRARDPRRVLAIESIADSPRGYIVYVDASTFPEGGTFWTRGAERATVLIAPGGATHLLVTLHLGPMAGIVQVSVAGAERAVPLEASGTTQFETNVPAGVRLVPISIQAPAQFRPADMDPTSNDRRRLGCQVRITLR